MSTDPISTRRPYIHAQMPSSAEETLALEQAPEFALQNAKGATVELADYRGDPVVLVFYRGFW